MSDLFQEDKPGRIVRVIDYETTGTEDDEFAEVIELGRIDLDLSTETIGNAWTALAKPKGEIPIETKAVHHITEAHVADAEPLVSLWGKFFEGCGESDVLAAHNAKFEKHFHPGNGRAWICTYKCALVIWPEAPRHNNQALRYWLDLDAEPDFDPALAEPPHRALPDAYVTARILRRLVREKPVNELIKISKFPALLHRINFGTKAKGQLYSEAPADYLDWIAYKSDLNEDVKFTAKYWLKKRGMAR